MDRAGAITIVEVVDGDTLGLVPPCADPRFDHRSCDYWEDAVRGSKLARPGWWQPPAPAPRGDPASSVPPDNPFAPHGREQAFNPFLSEAAEGPPPDLVGDDVEDPQDVDNPFAPPPPTSGSSDREVPRKVALLTRGLRVAGSYAKVLLRQGVPAVYAQFGPLSAYPRAQHIRDLYPVLPQAPLPAVIACVATAPDARGHGLARTLVADVCSDLGSRGFSAVEAYPDLTRPVDETSAARPGFWAACGFAVAVDDERFPVMRRELG